MKQFAGLVLVSALLAQPAMSQSASDVASVINGAQSCVSCNLFQAELSMLDLTKRNLSGARLRQADLSIATIDGADLSNSDLSIANLFSARLTGANLKGANLERTNFVGAYLGSVNFDGANMTGAVFYGADLRTARNITLAQLVTAFCDESTLLPEGRTVSDCAPTIN